MSALGRGGKKPRRPRISDLDLRNAERVRAEEAAQPLPGSPPPPCRCERPVVDSNDEQRICVRCGRGTATR